MTTPKYTPGPYRIEEITPGYARYDIVTTIDGQNYRVANVFGETEDNAKANAALIAAAPDLYALLSEINRTFYGDGSFKAMKAVMEKTKPLLEKARGEHTA